MEYVDTEAKEIHASQTISGNVGESYDASTEKYQLTIEGYILDESRLPQNAKGTFGKEEATVTYVYTKENAATVVISDKKNQRRLLLRKALLHKDCRRPMNRGRCSHL